MDGELGIYNKNGGGDKYKIQNIEGGGGDRKISKNREKIERLEKRIKEFQEEIKRLKEIDT